ncbi:MAG: helix-turn-helix transcriptional regulator [Proteobacteria bacterium]|nr:helix-turn-helix transcriptional regulator [Pseudomonadota bacterium]
MSNIATALKAEITRLSRRELKNATDGIKKASVQHWSEIASLKRRLASIETHLRQLDKMASRAVPVSAEPGPQSGIRYSAKGFQAQRQRLELTGPEVGFLLNVSPQTIYNWESGKTRPGAAQLPAIVALRKLSKRNAQAVLSQHRR